LNGRSAQFSGSAGRANPPSDGHDGTLAAVTELDSSCPRPPVTPPSVRTNPSVKAPLRLIPPLRLRTHARARTILNLRRCLPSLSPGFRKALATRAIPLAAVSGLLSATPPAAFCKKRSSTPAALHPWLAAAAAASGALRIQPLRPARTAIHTHIRPSPTRRQKPHSPTKSDRRAATGHHCLDARRTGR
jgi:hypothetical protein